MGSTYAGKTKKSGQAAPARIRIDPVESEVVLQFQFELARLRTRALYISPGATAARRSSLVVVADNISDVVRIGIENELMGFVQLPRFLQRSIDLAEALCAF